MIEKITGEHTIFEALENIYTASLTCEEALEIICNIFKHNLAYFSAIDNIHNSGKIANLLAVKLFPSRILSQVVVQWIKEGRYQELALLNKGMS